MTDTNISAIAARAYGVAAGLNEDASKRPDFGSMVKEAAQQVSTVGEQMNSAVNQAAMGQADLIDIVTAIAAAETSLETVISVRDQFIKAYQEVMRMPI